MSIDRRIGIRVDFSANGPMKGQMDQMKGGVDKLNESVNSLKGNLKITAPDFVGKWDERSLKRMGTTLSDIYKQTNTTAFNFDEPLLQSKEIVRTLTDGFRMLGPELRAGLLPVAGELKGIGPGFGFAQGPLKGLTGGLPASMSAIEDKLAAGVERMAAKSAPQIEAMHTFDQMRRSFDRTIATAGLSPNEARVFDVKGKVSKSMFSELMAQAREADEAQAAALDKQAAMQRGGMFRGRRVFAGAGFGALTLAVGAIPGQAGQAISPMVGQAMMGAGVGTMMAPNLKSAPMFTAVGSAIGIVFGMVKTGLEELFPTALEFNNKMRQIADGLKTVDDVAVSLSRGLELGEAAASVLPGATLAHIRATGVLGEPGTREARLAVATEERERILRDRALRGSGFAGGMAEGPATFGGFGTFSLGGERVMTDLIRAFREEDVALRVMTEAIRRGEFPGLITEAPMGTAGVGDTESITERLMAAATEHSPVVEAVGGVVDALDRWMGGIMSVIASFRPGGAA